VSEEDANYAGVHTGERQERAKVVAFMRGLPQCTSRCLSLAAYDIERGEHDAYAAEVAAIRGTRDPLLSLPACPLRACDICGGGGEWWVQGIGCSTCTGLKDPPLYALERDGAERYWRDLARVAMAERAAFASERDEAIRRLDGVEREREKS
jgi:hypothetical protein